MAAGRLSAQNEAPKPRAIRPSTQQNPLRSGAKKAAEQIATIHWQRVPLRDAIGRLSSLFKEQVFIDRRVDPGLRVTLDIEAGSAAEVIVAIAADNGLSSAQFGKLIYLGPSGAAEQLRTVGTARWQEIARLPPEVRGPLITKQATSWPRLTEPRSLISSVVEQRGWRLINAEKIPHDLWAAGTLPDASLAEQLSVLLIGFDFTFNVRPGDRSIELVALDSAASPPSFRTPGNNSTSRRKPSLPAKGQKQVYTLRVKEQPVRLVLQELMNRLHWAIQIDEEGIRASGGSIDKRVSFSVENADREHLLESLLTPAELEYQIEGDVVRIVPQRYGSK